MGLGGGAQPGQIGEEHGRVEGGEIVSARLTVVEVVCSLKRSPCRVDNKGSKATEDKQRGQPPRVSSRRLAESALLRQRDVRPAHETLRLDKGTPPH